MMYRPQHLKITLAALLIAVLGTMSAKAADDITFTGLDRKHFYEEPQKSSGLDALYVLWDVEGVSASFTCDDSAPKWYRYSSLGGGYAEELSGIVYDGNTSTLPQVQGDMGYIIEHGQKRFYFWVTDYSKHKLHIHSLRPDSDQECESTRLIMEYGGSPLYYYSINGNRIAIDQEIEVSYQTLEYSPYEEDFVIKDAVKMMESPAEMVVIYPAALARTVFTASGDRFLKEWGEPTSAQSPSFMPNAVDVMTAAEQIFKESDEPSNQIKNDASGLGGSAPAEISFTAQVTDAVIHNEWQMSADPMFSTIDYRITEKDLDYTFTSEGVTYVRFIGSNADGSCEAIGETFTVSIGASEILCPNAFSPGASPGVNDVWKVSYRSILDFRCHIFDRYGNEMCSFTDIEDGWDGTYRGKLVKPGVYYYVIEATGADGKNYKLSGDINILRYDSQSSSKPQQ